jgi:hypothetical protein
VPSASGSSADTSDELAAALVADLDALDALGTVDVVDEEELRDQVARGGSSPAS